jgi:phosphomethylpyrimidine synthase
MESIGTRGEYPLATTVTRTRSNGLGPELRPVAEAEGISSDRLSKLIASGRVVVPRSAVRDEVTPVLIGEGMSVKVNANLGSSKDIAESEEQMTKARVALDYGAHTLMDLSTGEDLGSLRSRLLSELECPVGTVPIYDAALSAQRGAGNIADLDEDHIFSAVERHASDGVDFLTLHAAVTKSTVDALKKSDRLLGAVSRGGAFIAASILHTGRENPLYDNYDYVLELAEKYDFTISLGDGLRPGCLHDATDRPQLEELMVSSELVKRARERDVQVMVEGPGHVPLDQIEANVKLEKAACDGAPFYVLGPLVTDIAPGYDHISGAIGGAVAAWAGADFLCVVTPAEHLCLPTVDDIRKGVIASRIAAHSAEVARGRGREWDDAISVARQSLDWDDHRELALDKEEFTSRRASRPSHDPRVCSMCSDLCAIKMLEDYLRDQ